LRPPGGPAGPVFAEAGRTFRGCDPFTFMTGPMPSQPDPHERPEEAELRGRIFTDLDRLAFALEMEAARHLDEGRDAECERLQEQRLGVRLAQRLVSGIWADEVHRPLMEWAEAYEGRVGAPSS
jgi:hypothetical protein